MYFRACWKHEEIPQDLRLHMKSFQRVTGIRAPDKNGVVPRMTEIRIWLVEVDIMDSQCVPDTHPRRRQVLAKVISSYESGCSYHSKTWSLHPCRVQLSSRKSPKGWIAFIGNGKYKDMSGDEGVLLFEPISGHSSVGFQSRVEWPSASHLKIRIFGSASNLHVRATENGTASINFPSYINATRRNGDKKRPLP